MQDKTQPTKLVGAVITVLAMIVVAGGLSARASAQQTQVIGGHGGPSVEVDLSVLDSLPPLATLPELLRPGLLPYAATTRGRLPFRGERDGGRRLSLGTAPAPRPIAKPKPPQVATRSVPAPTVTAPAPAAAKRPEIPSKPRIVAKSTPPAAGKPKIASVAPPPPAVTRAPVPQAKAQLPPRAPVIAATVPAPPKPKPVQTAARTSSTGTASSAPSNPTSVVEGGGVRLLFDDGQSAFGDAMAPPLGALVKDLKANNKRRVQLLAYAAAAEGNASKARRLSLSRALSVRAYLMAQGIASTRMDVRALGDRSNSGPANRVDVMVLVPR